MIFRNKASYWVFHIVYTVNSLWRCHINRQRRQRERELREAAEEELLCKAGFKAAADQQLIHIYWNIQQLVPTHFPPMSFLALEQSNSAPVLKCYSNVAVIEVTEHTQCWRWSEVPKIWNIQPEEVSETAFQLGVRWLFKIGGTHVNRDSLDCNMTLSIKALRRHMWNTWNCTFQVFLLFTLWERLCFDVSWIIFHCSTSTWNNTRPSKQPLALF